jgi:hypothetical protein
MPLASGKSDAVVSQNISELMRNSNRIGAQRRKKGSKAAQAMAIAIAMSQAGRSRPRKRKPR